MKRKILISINPEHVQNIIAGIKKYEYRKIAAKQDISSIIIYETTPIKRIVAEAEIVDVLELPPEELLEQTKKSLKAPLCQERNMRTARSISKQLTPIVKVTPSSPQKTRQAPFFGLGTSG